MPFSSVKLASFRNLIDAEIDTTADRVFLVGDNGQGKTNFLEAIYYLSFGNSFRGSVDTEVARRGSSEFYITGIARSSKEKALTDAICVRWKEKSKTISVNEKPIRDRKDLVELNPAVVFCHEDFSFAAGDPERRRFFFDQSASLVSAGYIDILRDYKRILKQRNAALKDRQRELLDLLDIQFAAKGIELMTERSRLQTALDEGFASRFEAVSQLGMEVRIGYRPNWPNGKDVTSILGHLLRKREDDLAVGTSLSGPHRDRWSFISSGRDFAGTASTGQLRLLSLTLRMMQAEYYSRATGRLPVILMDDVLLELDGGKRQRFLELLPESGQAFFTFLPGEPWEEYKTGSTMVYEVRDGRFAN